MAAAIYQKSPPPSGGSLAISAPLITPSNSSPFIFLQDNDLSAVPGPGLTDMSSVLKVLDLHANSLEKLPEEIGTLRELKVRKHEPF